MVCLIGTKSFSYQRVAYGGLNGMYYTASVTRKSGNGGVSNFLFQVEK